MKASISDILSLLTRELDLDEGEISESSTSEQIENWDSLAHLRVCMAIEDRFNVSIPMETISELRSVQAIVEFLDRA